MKNNKGNALGLITMGFLLMVVIYVAFGAIGAIYSANTHGCVMYNGSLTNCSQSDYAFNAINQTNAASITVFSMANYVPLILIALGLVAGIMMFVRG
jgi:hypothetical protein